jgi:nicotinate-nucleotide adenylyltransferase
MATELFELIRKRLEQSVKTKRYEHSLRVTQAAEVLCEKFGADFSRARIAGIAHDMCKELPLESLLELCERDGSDISALEKSSPSLLHGRAASVVLRDEYGVADEDILEAVRCHTVGKPGMSDIAKIIYIADKIEPGRKHSDTDVMRIEAFTLDELLYYVVDSSIGYLERKGEKVSPFSYELRGGLREML